MPFINCNVDLIFAGRYKIAYLFWLESLRLCSAEHPCIQKGPQHLEARKVFGNASEFTTEKELQNIFKTRPLRFYTSNRKLF